MGCVPAHICGVVYLGYRYHGYFVFTFVHVCMMRSNHTDPQFGVQDSDNCMFVSIEYINGGAVVCIDGCHW